jgi:hypothetical protein
MNLGYPPPAGSRFVASDRTGRPWITRQHLNRRESTYPAASSCSNDRGQLYLLGQASHFRDLAMKLRFQQSGHRRVSLVELSGCLG